MLAARAMQPGAPDPAEQRAPSDEDAPPLAIERFAAMSADIEAGAARDEVIARERISLAAWTRAQEWWLGKMADEVAQKRFDLTNRYNAAFVAQRRSRDGSARRADRKNKNKKKSPIDSPAKAALASPHLVAPPPSFVAPPPSFVAPPAPFLAPPAPRTMPAVAAPAFVAIHAPPLVASPAPTNLGGTVAAEVISPFASGAALPFKPGRAAIAEPSASPVAAPTRSRKGATLDGTSSSFGGRAIPFIVDALPRAPEAPSDAPTAPMPAIDLGVTAPAGLTSPFASGAPLPFRAASTGNVAPAPSAARPKRRAM